MIGSSAFALTHSGNSDNKIPFVKDDSLETDRMKYMNEVMASIKGKEKMRADSVFKNLKVIKGEGQYICRTSFMDDELGLECIIGSKLLTLSCDRKVGIRFTGNKRHCKRHVEYAGNDQ